MSSDFSLTGRSAREQIPVPTLSMDSIRKRSHAAQTRARLRTFVTAAAVSLVVVGAGVGVGAKIYDGVHVWFSGNKVATVVHSLVFMRNPMASDLRTAIAHATFPVVFPAGIPAGTRVNRVMLAPLDRPSAITISYTNPGGFNTTVVLLDPAVVDANAVQVPGGSMRSPRTFSHWRVGGEIVVAGGEISAGDLNQIKAATSVASASESLAATEAMLPDIIVLGGTVRLEIAERLRPANGRSVLIDELNVRSIARLVKDRKPILDTRFSYADKIGNMNARIVKAVVIRKPDVVAIPADGVRAIDAVLNSSGERASRDRCGCEILFNQPNPSAYRIWKIPLSAASTVQTYSVDARTFAVTASTVSHTQR